MRMSSYSVRMAIWEGRIGTERHQRYFSRIASRHHRWHRGLSTVVMVGAAAAASDFVIEWLPSFMAPLMMLGVAIASAAALVRDDAKVAAEAETAGRHYGQLVDRWDTLWRQQDRDGIERRIDRLRTEVNLVHAPRGRVNNRINEESAALSIATAQAAYDAS
jgi:hypothetical protein